MEERDIRLDQTKKVFEVLSNLIKENEPCSYRYLIYDLLGFEPKDYNILLQGMIITNALCDLNSYIDILNKLEKWLEEQQNLTCGCGITPEYIYAFENCLDKLKELKGDE